MTKEEQNNEGVIKVKLKNPEPITVRIKRLYPPTYKKDEFFV